MKLPATFGNPALLLATSILLQSFSLLSLKYATLQTGSVVYFLIVAGIGFIGLRALIWQSLLNMTELSRVYPFAALVQVLIFLYAIILFRESVSPNNVVGLLVMLVGIYFMSRQQVSNDAVH